MPYKQGKNPFKKLHEGLQSFGEKHSTWKAKKAAERQKKFDSYKALNKSEQVKMLLELGLTKAEIRALKYEKDRVDKLIELEE